MKKWQASIILLLISIVWGAGYLITDNVLLYIKPLHMQVFRFGIASLVISIFYFKDLIKAKKEAIKVGFIMGLFFFIAMSLQTLGLTFTTVPKNAFLTVTNVIWVPLIIGLFTSVKPKPFLVKGIFMMLVGFFVLVFDIDIFDLKNSLSSLSKQSTFNLGDLLTIVAAIFFALHYIVTERYVLRNNIIIVLIFQLYTATILSLIVSLFVEGPFDYDQVTFIKALPALLFLAIPSSIGAFGLLIVAQRYLPASNTAIICSLESMFAAIIAIFFGEPITSSLVLGSIIITFGIIWAQTGFQFNYSNHDLIIEEETKKTTR